MSKKNDKLILEDYEAEFSYNKSKSNLKISFNRIAFIFFIFFIIALIFSSKVVYLGTLDSNKKNNELVKSDFRSSILDREGNLLAKTVITTNIGINPNLIIDKKKLLLNLKLIFPNKNYDEISNKINGNKFFYLEKKINHEKYEKLLLLGDKSIIPEEKISRIYPHGNLFSHIIGQIDNDNNGISGIEKYFDYELRTSENSLQLTVDTNLQYLIREELVKSKEIFNNIGSAAILMDVRDGSIISMVSLPDFDLNKRANIKDVSYINRSTKAVYELGSVFKTFTFAAGIEEGVIEPETEFVDLPKKIWCAGKDIGEYDDKIPSDLTAEQILIRSGNIGSVRIAQKLGEEKLEKFLNKIGILDKIEFDIEEVGQPEVGRWGKCKLATVAFGHGISTTPLQLAKGYSIISNGGYDIKPTLIKKNKTKKRKRILKKGISEKINPILRKIVSTEEGTASFVDIEGYDIGGKTGTADQPSGGNYSGKKVNTFASVFPTSEVKYVLVVLLDDPKPNKDYVYTLRNGQKYKGNWRNTAGWTTVLIAKKIIESIGPILATKY